MLALGSSRNPLSQHAVILRNSEWETNLWALTQWHTVGTNNTHMYIVGIVISIHNCNNNLCRQPLTVYAHLQYNLILLS